MRTTAIEYLWGYIKSLSTDNKKWLSEKLLNDIKSEDERKKAKPTNKGKRKIEVSPEILKYMGAAGKDIDYDTMMEEKAKEKSL
ncbi:MAG: hypothetical protein UH071_08065 [Paludibacteraceae bacterium]|nr:hypothetical protein [Paludibacteraceae bacterium]